MSEQPSWEQLEDVTTGTRIRTRKLTDSEIISQPDMVFQHGRGMVRRDSYYGGESVNLGFSEGVKGKDYLTRSLDYTDDGGPDGSLPINPTYNSYVTRDQTASGFFEWGYRRNSIIFGLINIRCIAIQQAPLIIYAEGDENEEPILDSPLTDLFEHPNPYFSFKKLMAHLEGFGCIGGNSYVYTPRNDYGIIEAMYHYNSSQITPVASLGKWLHHYIYDNGANFRAMIPVDNVMQIGWGLNEWNRPMKSISPLASLATEIDTDNARKTLDLATLQNGAIPAMVITLPPKKNPSGLETDWTQPQLDVLDQKYRQKFSGRNLGKTMFAAQGTEVNVLGYDPRKMQTNATAELPESRSCHVLGIPMQMTSLLMAGRYKTFNNYEQALLSLYRDTMIPRYGDYADMYTHFFSKEVFKGDRRKYKFKFDYSKIPILKKDSIEATNTEFEGGMSTLDEARTNQGRPPDAQYGSKYLWELEAMQKAGTGQAEPEDMEVVEEQRAKEKEHIIKQAKKGRAKIL